MSRPLPSFHGFIAPRRRLIHIRRQIDGAKALGQPFPHSIFLGPSGVGKTELARACAKEFETNLIELHGRDSQDELCQKLTQAKHSDFVLIDEAHGLPSKAQEMLYRVIDSHAIPKFAASGGPAISEVADFTIVLATDQPGSLRMALHRRISFRTSLTYYSPAQMRQIIDHMATGLNILLTPQAANQIAKVCWGIPRTARHHLENLRRYFPDPNGKLLTLENVRDFLKGANIDGRGLESVHRTYLRHIHKFGHASLQSLAKTLSLDSRYIEQQIEPPLLRAGLIHIASIGRTMTPAGQEYIASHGNRME